MDTTSLSLAVSILNEKGMEMCADREEEMHNAPFGF